MMQPNNFQRLARRTAPWASLALAATLTTARIRSDLRALPPGYGHPASFYARSSLNAVERTAGDLATAAAVSAAAAAMLRRRRGWRGDVARTLGTTVAPGITSALAPLDRSHEPVIWGGEPSRRMKRWKRQRTAVKRRPL